MTTYFRTPEGRTERIQHRVIGSGKKEESTASLAAHDTSP